MKFNEAKREVETKPAVEREIEHVIELDFLDDDQTSRDDDAPVEAPVVRPAEPEELPRRSQRARRPPDYYDHDVNVTNELPEEPTTVDEALDSPEKEVLWLRR